MSSQFLSSTRTDLDSPGNVKNDVYYDTAQIVVQDCELNTHIGRYQQTLTSLNFGATSQITIPNCNIVHEIFLYLKLPPIVANQTLSSGWGYDAIRSIEYTWGQSNVSSLRLSGKSIMQLALMSCETKEKRSEVVKVIGGEPHNADTGSSEVDACLILPFPWSNAQGVGKSKGFDTSLLNNPITLQITMNTADKIGFGGSATLPTAFTEAYVFLRESEFADRSNSIKMDLMRNPSLMYQMPFYHKTSPSPKTGIVLDGVTENRISLREFIESDLYNIVFSVHNTNLQTATGSNAPSPGQCCELVDIELLYNGQHVYRTPGLSGRLIGSLFDSGATGVNDALTTQVSPWNSVSHTSYVYNIPFGTMKNINFEYKYDNTGRYSSQDMELRFKARQIPNATGTGELHLTYVFGGVGACQNGVMTLQFA